MTANRITLRLAPVLFVLLWSSAFVAVRIGLTEVTPLAFLTVRFALAAAVLLAIAMVVRTEWTALRGVGRHLVVAGVLINGLYLSGAYLALREDHRGAGAAASGRAPGVGPVARPRPRRPRRRLPCFRHDPLSEVLPGSPAPALEHGPTFGRWTWSAEVITTTLYLALVVSLGAQVLLMFMLRHGKAGTVASNFYLTPGVAAVMGWLVLDEGLRPAALVGLVLASVGVWLAQRGERGPGR